MDAKLQRIKELILQKEAVDAELEQLLGGGPTQVLKQRTCKRCGQHGHRSDTCPNKDPQNEMVQLPSV